MILSRDDNYWLPFQEHQKHLPKKRRSTEDTIIDIVMIQKMSEVRSEEDITMKSERAVVVIDIVAVQIHTPLMHARRLQSEVDVMIIDEGIATTAADEDAQIPDHQDRHHKIGGAVLTRLVGTNEITEMIGNRGAMRARKEIKQVARTGRIMTEPQTELSN